MAEMSPCQRPDCDQPGKPRAMTNPANGKDIKLHLCDEDYDERSRTSACRSGSANS